MTSFTAQSRSRGFIGIAHPIILAVFSGILLIFSFPKFGIGLLAWVAFIPLFFAIKTTDSPRKAALYAFITGLVAQIGLLYWISHVIVMYGYLPLYIGVLAMVLLSAAMSVYFSIFAAGVIFLRNRGFSEIVTAPLLWTILEYLKAHLFTGFPWENLAYSQFKYLHIIQFTDITGIYGLSFIIMFINVMVFDLVVYRQQGRKFVTELASSFVILVLILAYGQFSLHRVALELKSAPAMEVALIQGNMDQTIKWNPLYQKETIDIYSSLSLKKAPVGRGLIVWPETATPFFYQEILAFSRMVANVPRLTSDWLLFGSPSYRRDGSTTYYMNSAYLLNPDGKIAGKYDKVHLVPYGEYVPLRKFFPFINKLVAGIGDFRKGESVNPLTIEGRHALGVLICYEGIFPEISREYRAKGADLLVNITNDAWFGNTSAPYQHLSMTALRAVENRVFFIRSANTGISAIISPTGKIMRQTDLFKRTTLKGSVKFLDRKTIYALYGDIFVYICIFLLGVILFSSIKGDQRLCWMKSLRK
ncbi:MAG: apolipoprotein N-acyltransferase [Syntrophaceae bacterium]|nr:apolipoprotein N-acyltransferase [Syntrophaceae bacterium]